MNTWTRRRSDCFASAQVAEQALPGRAKSEPDLDRRVELMQDGKVVLIGCARSVTTEAVARIAASSLAVATSEPGHGGIAATGSAAHGVAGSGLRLDLAGILEREGRHYLLRVQSEQDNQATALSVDIRICGEGNPSRTPQ